MSFEGNLTPEDAYFSGQAADHADPAGFKRALSSHVDQLVTAGRAPSSYADSIGVADAESMWALGRDGRTSGADGSFGTAYRGLPIPTRYVWATSTIVPATRRYLATHAIAEHRLPVEQHWPWVLDPEAAADALTGFIEQGIR